MPILQNAILHHFYNFIIYPIAEDPLMTRKVEECVLLCPPKLLGKKGDIVHLQQSSTAPKLEPIPNISC